MTQEELKAVLELHKKMLLKTLRIGEKFQSCREWRIAKNDRHAI